MLDLVDNFVEEIGGAAMGGNDVEAAAPQGAGLADGIKQTVVRIEGEFVENALTAFPGLGIGIGTSPDIS